MKEEAQSNVQPEREEKQQGYEPPIQSQKTATPNLPNLSQTGIQNLTRENILELQRTIGNRAVARLMAQRQEEEEEENLLHRRNQRQEEEDEEDLLHRRIQREEAEDVLEYPGPRSQNERSVLEYPGPRSKPLRENRVQQQGGSSLMSSPNQRGVKMGGLKSVGDAHHLSGDGLYGWDREMSAGDVRDLVNGLVTNQASAIEGKPIYIFSGTHGTETGDLVNTGADSFVGQDQATAEDVMSDPETPEGTQIKVVDVNIFSKTEVAGLSGMTEWIRILAWCFSERSYKNRETLKSNWWPEPDKL